MRICLSLPRSAWKVWRKKSCVSPYALVVKPESSTRAPSSSSAGAPAGRASQGSRTAKTCDGGGADWPVRAASVGGEGS